MFTFFYVGHSQNEKSLLWFTLYCSFNGNLQNKKVSPSIREFSTNFQLENMAHIYSAISEGPAQKPSIINKVKILKI